MDSVISSIDSVDSVKFIAEQMIEEALLTLEKKQIIKEGIVPRPIILEQSKSPTIHGQWFSSILVRTVRQHILNSENRLDAKIQGNKLIQEWTSLTIQHLNQKSHDKIRFDSCSFGTINVFLIKENNDTDNEASGSNTSCKYNDQSIKIKEINTEASTSSLENVNQNSMYQLQIIGTIHSCFRTKYAAPRQGLLVPSSRGVIELARHLSPEFLEGLSDFSHCWIVWLFHQASTATSHSGQLKPKIRPPKLEGSSMGIFATRSPHRPSPIGLSVVKIESTKGRQVTISGLDIVDGTPLLDIKPYHPLDIIPSDQVRYPKWIPDVEGNHVAMLDRVTIPNEIRVGLNKLFESVEYKQSRFGGKGPFKFFATVDHFLQTVTESLTLDPRTIQQHREESKKGENVFFLDNFDVFYSVNHTEKTATVLQIAHKNITR